MLGTKLIAVLLIVFVLLIWFRGLLIWILGLIALYFIIRWIADIYWWGNDRGKW